MTGDGAFVIRRLLAELGHTGATEIDPTPTYAWL
jgi:hypothetical protein